MASKLKLKTQVGTQLKATKPKSVKSLQKALLRDIKRHDFTQSYECGVANVYPREVVAWCVDWLNSSGTLQASYHPFEGANLGKLLRIRFLKFTHCV